MKNIPTISIEQEENMKQLDHLSLIRNRKYCQSDKLSKFLKEYLDELEERQSTQNKKN